MMLKKRQIVGNSLSVLVNRLTQSLTTFVLITFIARLLGPYELGQYLLAFSYYYIFMTLASQGFKILFTREIARNPSKTPIYLVSGTFLQFLFSIIGYELLAIVVWALPYSADTTDVCYIMGLTIIPFALSNITEAILQAQEKMYLIAISAVPVYILRLLVMIWAMNLKYGVSVLSWILVISETLIFLLQWGLVGRFIKFQWLINWDFIWFTLKSARTFMAIEGVAVLNIRMQTLILSLLGGEVAVGLYGAVAQLMQPFEIISSSLAVAIFPSLTKVVTYGREKQRNLVESMVEISLVVALPFIVGLLFIGRDLLVFLYRDPSFAQAFLALNLVSFGMIATSFGRPLSFALVANGYEKVNLREVVVTTVVGGLLSVVLVSQYQLTGAAIAVLFMSVLSLIQYMYSVYVRIFTLRLWRITRRPLLISLVIVAVFLILQEITHNLIATMITASTAYVLLISVVGVYAFGGPSSVWNKLLRNQQ